ncbi:Retrovirus poly protein [Rutstroemia sp. NJR-2017a BBW]|nr:Retrovirus poly protein [Rutstroemia sp. NJR-2017a BBW]
MYEAQLLAKRSILAAQQRMCNTYNAHCQPDAFEVGDWVWLDMRQYNTQRPSRKLDSPTNGPFHITRKVNNSYELALPASMKVHLTSLRSWMMTV